MKKQLMYVVNTTLFSKFIKTTFVVLMLAGAGYTTAQATPVSSVISNSGPGVGKTVINHIFSDDESLVFEVKVENASGEKFTILVRDKTGNTLYRGNFNDKDFSKNFRLPKGESDKITFVIKSDSGNKAETFVINTNTRIVDDVVIKKVI